MVSAMAWCMISTLIGAIIFGAGMAFEKFLSADVTEPEIEENQEKLPEKEDMKLFGQWKNLLDYDGTRQEVDFDDR